MTALFWNEGDVIDLWFLLPFHEVFLCHQQSDKHLFHQSIQEWLYLSEWQYLVPTEQRGEWQHMIRLDLDLMRYEYLSCSFVAPIKKFGRELAPISTGQLGLTERA